MCENHNEKTFDRRQALRGGIAATAVAAVATTVNSSGASAAENPYADPAKPALPPSDMVLDLKRTALVVTDPQIDFLSPNGVTWGVVGKIVEEHGTVGNLAKLFRASDASISCAFMRTRLPALRTLPSKT